MHCGSHLPSPRARTSQVPGHASSSTLNCAWNTKGQWDAREDEEDQGEEVGEKRASEREERERLLQHARLGWDGKGRRGEREREEKEENRERERETKVATPRRAETDTTRQARQSETAPQKRPKQHHRHRTPFPKTLHPLPTHAPQRRDSSPTPPHARQPHSALPQAHAAPSSPAAPARQPARPRPRSPPQRCPSQPLRPPTRPAGPSPCTKTPRRRLLPGSHPPRRGPRRHPPRAVAAFSAHRALPSHSITDAFTTAIPPPSLAWFCDTTPLTIAADHPDSRIPPPSSVRLSWTMAPACRVAEAVSPSEIPPPPHGCAEHSARVSVAELRRIAAPKPSSSRLSCNIATPPPAIGAEFPTTRVPLRSCTTAPETAEMAPPRIEAVLPWRTECALTSEDPRSRRTAAPDPPVFQRRCA
eukprot:3719465-Rhodomonas_salina.2